MSTYGEDAALGTKTWQYSLSDYSSQVKMQVKYIRHLWSPEMDQLVHCPRIWIGQLGADLRSF